MDNSFKNNILYCLIFLISVATFSACGGSSSSSTKIPDYSSVYYVHNLVFKNGTTLSTGYNAFGQLGRGNLDNRSVPGPLSKYYPFKGFATGGDHSVAFTDTGEVYSWGYNAYGQLGNSSTTYSNVPVKTTFLPGVKSVAVAAGAFHTLSISDDGKVWTWGWNNYGQLGYLVGAGYSIVPIPIVDAATGGGIPKAVAIAANGYNSMALTEKPNAANPLVDKVVWAWGSNLNGQLGYNPENFNASPTPRIVPGLPDGITGIASGSAFSYAVDVNGEVWAWGNNSNSQLGNGTIMADSNIPSSCATATIPSYIPVQVMTSLTDKLTGVIQVAAGYHHGLALLRDGSVWAWGSNLLGQLGTGPNVVTGDSCFAVKVALPKDANGVSLKAKDIRAFGSSSMAQTESGAWYVWGYNLYGQLGTGADGYNSNAFTPVKMSGF